MIQLVGAVEIHPCVCVGTGIRFCNPCHKYWNGTRQLTSVTTLITTVWPRNDNAPEDAIEKARWRGIWVDAQFTSWLRGCDLEIPAGTNQGWVDALEQAIRYWEKERLGSRVECQVQLYGSDFAGTADLIVEGSEIVDLKCTYDISKHATPQLGGYGDLLTHSRAHQQIQCGVLHCHRHLKKGANFRRIDYPEAHRQWAVLRDYWRLTRAA